MSASCVPSSMCLTTKIATVAVGPIVHVCEHLVHLLQAGLDVGNAVAQPTHQPDVLCRVHIMDVLGEPQVIEDHPEHLRPTERQLTCLPTPLGLPLDLIPEETLGDN